MYYTIADHLLRLSLTTEITFTEGYLPVYQWSFQESSFLFFSDFHFFPSPLKVHLQCSFRIHLCFFVVTPGVLAFQFFLSPLKVHLQRCIAPLSVEFQDSSLLICSNCWRPCFKFFSLPLKVHLQRGIAPLSAEFQFSSILFFSNCWHHCFTFFSLATESTFAEGYRPSISGVSGLFFHIFY